MAICLPRYSPGRVTSPKERGPSFQVPLQRLSTRAREGKREELGATLSAPSRTKRSGAVCLRAAYAQRSISSERHGSCTNLSSHLSQIWSRPHTGQFDGGSLSGRLAKLLGSTSIPVETSRPVSGHLILRIVIDMGHPSLCRSCRSRQKSQCQGQYLERLTKLHFRDHSKERVIGFCFSS